MEELIKTITSNTLYLAVAVILGVVIVLAVIKRMMKLIVLAVIVLACYVGYLHFTGQKVPKTREETVKHISEKLEQGKEILQKEMKNIDRSPQGR